jgi:hypothetical protein
MTLSEGLEFVETIEATMENAKSIVSLVRQDAKAGNMEVLYESANPDDHSAVSVQHYKLYTHPERYSGYTKDGQLVAFIKQHRWTTDNELPFAKGGRKIALTIKKMLRLYSETDQWFVSGLVVSDRLEPYERNPLLKELLRKSFMDSDNGKGMVVNIILHDSDPLLDIAPKLGFVQIGKRGVAPGAPGVKQRLFQRLATN